MVSVCIAGIVMAGCSDGDSTGKPGVDGDVNTDGDDSNDDIDITEEDIGDQDLDNTEVDGDNEPVDNTEDPDTVDDIDDLDNTEGDALQEAEPEIENEAEVEAEMEIEAETEVEVEPEEELAPCDGCRIGDTCVDDEDENPDNSCEVCDHAANPNGWTAAVGTACNDEDDCTADDVCDDTAQCTGTAYTCNDHGTCNIGDDICTCDGLFGGDYCDGCIPGYYNYPTCEQVICDVGTCNDNGFCADGICTCRYGFGGQFCDECDANFEGYPDCAITCGTGLEYVQRLAQPESMKAVAIKGNYVFTGSGNNVVVVDISPLPASNATVVATKTLTNSPFDMAIQGDYLYVAANTSGLAILDISDPTNPGDPVYLSTLGQMYGVVVEGDYCYMQARNGLTVVDVSDRANPVKGETASLTISTGIAFRNNHVYLTYFTNIDPRETGLAIYDVSDPDSIGTPVIVNTTYAQNNYCDDVYLDGDYAYIAHGLGGVAVIDVSDPTSPGAAQMIPTVNEAETVLKYRNTIYVGTYNRGYNIIDITDLENPGEATGTGIGGIYYLAQQGGYLYGVTGGVNIQELQISKITCN